MEYYCLSLITPRTIRKQSWQLLLNVSMKLIVVVDKNVDESLNPHTFNDAAVSCLSKTFERAID